VPTFPDVFRHSPYLAQMPFDSFLLHATFPVSPEMLYAAWLDSDSHSAFTGSPAIISGHEGGSYSTWDGYITGKILQLETGSRILQTWRTTEFPDDAPDSHLELTLEPTPAGCRLTLHHWGIPAGQKEKYTEGWEEFYFTPMRRYFGV
jgi:activator of HSP90 ATPase